LHVYSPGDAAAHLPAAAAAAATASLLLLLYIGHVMIKN